VNALRCNCSASTVLESRYTSRRLTAVVANTVPRVGFQATTFHSDILSRAMDSVNTGSQAVHHAYCNTGDRSPTLVKLDLIATAPSELSVAAEHRHK
jgi:hypothetical protein